MSLMDILSRHRVLIAGLGLAGGFAYLASRPAVPGLPSTPTPPAPAPPPTPGVPSVPATMPDMPDPSGTWPGLVVGDHVIVDPLQTSMPPELQAYPSVQGVVVMTLDAVNVLVHIITPPTPAFEGTIPRKAILRVVPASLAQNVFGSVGNITGRRDSTGESITLPAWAVTRIL